MSNIAKDLQPLVVPIDNLTPLDENPRRGDVDAVARSYKQFGQRKPIVARRKSNKNGKPTGMVIAGNHQLLAAKSLGWTEIAVVFVDDDAKTAKAFALADNRTHDLGDYDNVMLASLLEELKLDDNLFAATGYTPTDLKDILTLNAKKAKLAGNTDPDDIPTPDDVPAKAKTGDIYELGNHRLIVGDSTKAETYTALMAGQTAHMCFTDPPYNVDYGNNMKDKMRGKDRRIMNDNLGTGFGQFLTDACTNILAHTTGACYIAMSSSELHTLQSAWLAAGGKWSTFIIWAKNTFTLGRSDYQRQYEPILYGWSAKGTHYWCGDRSQSDVWNYDKPSRSDLHPTMKPVELVVRAIENSSKIDEIVLDPFGGSGTTMIAAEQTGRHARLIELDPRFADVIIARWEGFTGRTATKVTS